MIGLPVTKETIDRVLGTLCQRLNADFTEVETLKGWSDNTPQGDIEALGYSPDEAYLVKLVIDELNLLKQVYEGAAALAVAHDFREQARKAWGIE